MARLKLGMIGGGQGAFIGGVHRIAARIDDEWELVAGALSSTPDKARASGEALGLASDRIYASYTEMAVAEAARADGIDAVAIVTPNHMHAGPAIAFLEAGINVICDKPLANDMDSARAIADAVSRTGKHFILTHNYTGYPLMRQAREMVANGDLGTLRMVTAEYIQDWLTEPADPDNKQAAWRTDPKRSGAGGCIGDIGTHAFNLAQFVTGLTVEEVSAELTSFVKGRQVDDNVTARFRFAGGARGTLWASQVAVGHENGLSLRIYGDKGGLVWHQENPNVMTFTRFGEPPQILTRGGASPIGASQALRVPPGHPEGYLEGFATIYSEAAAIIRGENGLAPGIVDGIAGMRFIEAALESADNNGNWIGF
ncbi:MAG: Gfo/Idh/MocA family protein [Paracoccaceae bacterium]